MLLPTICTGVRLKKTGSDVALGQSHRRADVAGPELFRGVPPGGMQGDGLPKSTEVRLMVVGAL